MNRKGGIIILYGCNSAGGSGKLGLPSFQTDCCDCGQIFICRVPGPEDLSDPFDSVNQQSVGEVFGTTDHDAIKKAIKLQIFQGDANRMFDRIITPAVACHAVIFTAKHPDLTWLWSVGHCQLSLQVFAILYCSIYPAPHRASAPPAPSTGSPSRTVPNNPTWWTAYHGRAGSEETNLAKKRPCNKFGLFPGRQTAVKATHLGPVSAAQRSSRRQMTLRWDKNESFWFTNVGR